MIKKKNRLRINEILIGSLLVLLVSLLSYFLLKSINYRVVALLLLVTVSVIAMLFDIVAVLLSAVLSSLIWNFFFIPPTLTFHIDNTEDLLMFLMYFLVALINAILTYKIRQVEKKAREKEEKEKVIKLYNTLLNSLSHELRTPIATILSSIDFLKDNKQISDENKNTILDELDFASTRLNRQVENLLNMSRLESGMLKLKYDWVDINELVYGVMGQFQYHKTHLIEFHENLDGLPLYRTDGVILEQIIYNLIHNSIQHTGEHTKINIEVIESSFSLILLIEDNGPGFPEAELEKVFDKFYRLPKTKTGGIGLGLSIVKGFTEALGGVLKLENKLGGGARFTIEIPCKTSFITNLKNE